MTHAEKLNRIKTLMESPEIIELDALAPEAAFQEIKRLPIDPPTLAEAMKFRREQTGETAGQIAKRAGIPARLWGLLESGHTDWTMSMARKLHAIGIPASVLLG
jgi:antitoxin component HigA of HigAB toxin-antitoxin module